MYKYTRKTAQAKTKHLTTAHFFLDFVFPIFLGEEWRKAIAYRWKTAAQQVVAPKGHQNDAQGFEDGRASSTYRASSSF